MDRKIILINKPNNNVGDIREQVYQKATEIYGDSIPECIEEQIEL